MFILSIYHWISKDFKFHKSYLILKILD